MGLFDQPLVVVPFDFSELAGGAIDKALQINPDPTRIHVLHVAQLPPVMDPGTVWRTVDDESMEKHLRASFANVAEARNCADVNFHVRFGDPGTRITEFAEQVGADLIVIPSHGRTGLAHLLIGSVAERVVRLAHCPVLVLREKP